MIECRHIEASEYLMSVTSNDTSAPAQHNEKREEYSSHLRHPNNMIKLQTIQRAQRGERVSLITPCIATLRAGHLSFAGIVHLSPPHSRKRSRQGILVKQHFWPIPLIGLFRQLVSAAERKSGGISVCGRMLIGCSSQRDWLCFQLQSRSGRGPDSACRSNIGCLAPPACCYPTFWQREEGRVRDKRGSNIRLLIRTCAGLFAVFSERPR